MDYRWVSIEYSQDLVELTFDAFIRILIDEVLTN